MRKLLGGLLVFGLILLSGCGQQYSTDDALTIQTAIQQSFLSSDVFSFIDNNPFVSSGIVRESLGLYSNTTSDILASNVEIAITTDNAKNNKFSSIVFSGSLEDKTHSDVFNGSGTIHYIGLGTKRYINWHEGYIDLGPGNAESFIVRMILDSIRSQWMLIDDNELIDADILTPIDGAKILSILSGIRDIVREEGLFSPSSPTISGTYPLTMAASGDINTHIKNLYIIMGKNIANVNTSFVGSIQTSPEAKLIIENFRDSNDSRELSGYIGVRHGSLTIENNNTERTVSWKERKRLLDIDVTTKKDGEEQLFVSVSVTPKSINNAIGGLAYEGTIRFALSANNLITFPIAGLYGIYIVDETQFFEPTRYILMSQLFGDEYGIARILESE